MVKFTVDTTGKEVVEAFKSEIEEKTFVLTGPSSNSLGAQTALSLAKRNAKSIILAGRNLTKIAPLIEEIGAVNAEISVSFIHLDLCDNATVRKAARQINDAVEGIDALINCAGVMGVRNFKRSIDGVESHFAANHLGHFLLTNLVLDKIIAARGRVVNVTSMAYTLAEVNTEDVNFDNGKNYNAWSAYGQSKTANILFTLSLDRALSARGVSAVAADPGMVFDTELQKNSGVDQDFLVEGFQLATDRNGGVAPPHALPVSLEQGCASILLAALDKTVKAEAPILLHQCNIMPVIPYASDMVEAGKLWKMSEKMVGQNFDILFPSILGNQSPTVGLEHGR